MTDRYSPDEWGSFLDLVDSLLLNEIASGKRAYDEILSSLPGVYPSVLLEAYRRIVSNRKIPQKFLDEAIAWTSQADQTGLMVETDPSQNWDVSKLPIPHPLDFEWRFSEKAVNHLLYKSLELTDVKDSIALFAVPSVFWKAFRIGLPRKILLLESSEATIDFLANQNVPEELFIKCNLMEDDLPKTSAKLVISDPPWYRECFRSFFWSASQLCSQGGFVILSTPPVGTRPNVTQEWGETLNWAKVLGFKLVEMQEGVLPYVTPTFERNALKAEGIIRVPKEWRRGNLAIFLREEDYNLPRPPSCVSSEDWQEEAIDGVRFRFRRMNRALTFFDPSLEPILPGDILPSVSRYDERRAKADVWTSGNRIFKCHGTAILQKIIEAISNFESPFLMVEDCLKRKLTHGELQSITATAKKLNSIVEIERAEYRFYERN